MDSTTAGADYTYPDDVELIGGLFPDEEIGMRRWDLFSVTGCLLAPKQAHALINDEPVRVALVTRPEVFIFFYNIGATGWTGLPFSTSLHKGGLFREMAIKLPNDEFSNRLLLDIIVVEECSRRMLASRSRTVPAPFSARMIEELKRQAALNPPLPRVVSVMESLYNARSLSSLLKESVVRATLDPCWNCGFHPEHN